MKNILTTIRLPALMSLILVVPFMIMELVNTQNLDAIFNIPLFGMLWILPMAFLLVLIPIVRNMRADIGIAEKPVTLIFSIILLIHIALLWGGIVADQMPCFLGVPNCD